ncbi:polyadenylate-binding protein-interacting protein 4 isoform X2 [Daucus carota subsp. sativus]|uniref:polyadenylate-binding protein-interacting protein 4 isoform X2 n=1 Tax=Daucus carota subsp. sativus TaxID=79200 RepID=UPI003082DDB4
MVSRNRGGFSTEDERVSDMLVFTTMCIIGHYVDVFVKDGSVFSGTFYTSSLDQDYSIVLKKARMTKKGNRVANLGNKGVIETLVVKAQDLVQVVSKAILHSADGGTGNASRIDIGATSSVNATVSVEKAAQTTQNGKHGGKKKRINRSRSTARNGNGVVDCSPKGTDNLHIVADTESRKNIHPIMSKSAEDSGVASDTRIASRDESQQKQGDCEEKSEYRKEHNILEVQAISTVDAPDGTQSHVFNIPKKITSKVLTNNGHDSSVCLDVKIHGPEVAPISETIPSVVSTAISATIEATSETHLSTVKPANTVLQKISSLNKHAKEFKLNPGAKTFSPSSAQQRSVPSVVPAVTSVAYMTETSPVVSISAAQPEVGTSPFVPRSLPVKYVPYGGLVSSNGETEMQYSQPVVGHLGSRTQPVRYASHYHPVQAGTTYVHPTSQNLMVGRLGPLVYVHPVSQDVVQGAPAFSQVSNIPLFAQQVHLPKHQGNAAAQSLQWCPSTPYIAAGQQPFAVAPSHIPISQPHFPMIRPIHVPAGSNGFLGSKFS